MQSARQSPWLLLDTQVRSVATIASPVTAIGSAGGAAGADGLQGQNACATVDRCRRVRLQRYLVEAGGAAAVPDPVGGSSAAALRGDAEALVGPGSAPAPAAVKAEGPCVALSCRSWE